VAANPRATTEARADAAMTKFHVSTAALNITARSGVLLLTKARRASRIDPAPKMKPVRLG
jgi:hypothetical protein